MASGTARRRRARNDQTAGPSAALPATTQSLTTTAAITRYDDIPAPLAEALRRIVNRHELRHENLLPATISATAPVRGEGTTTVSQALATLIAQEMGRYVCWVDCSWLAGGRSEETDDDDGRPSLIEILADRSKVLAAFQSAPDLSQLLVLNSGKVPASKRNMIVRSPEFDQLLDVLTAEFDHVIFDIPPVLENANGLAFLRRSDASLLVVRQRATSLAQFERALDATQPTPNLGVVLNRFDSKVPHRLRRVFGD